MASLTMRFFRVYTLLTKNIAVDFPNNQLFLLFINGIREYRQELINCLNRSKEIAEPKVRLSVSELLAKVNQNSSIIIINVAMICLLFDFLQFPNERQDIYC